MHRLVWPLLLVCACGESKDDRPLELEYLTQSIFAPACGTTQCHSTFVQEKDNVFDTAEGVRRSLVDHGLIVFDSTQFDPDDPENAALIVWMTEIDPYGLGTGRMPLDAPLPNKDIVLLEDWIAAEAPGAQCNPESNGGMACHDKELVQCNPDWSFGARVMLCSGDCIQGVCR